VEKMTRDPCWSVFRSFSGFFLGAQSGSFRNESSCFLGAFAKLRKATISIVVSICLSVRMEQLGSHWTEFDETLYLSFLRKSVQ
jgi:hypothetical protein